MFTCVCVSVSLTSVLPRVQPEFSRPYTAHLMRVGGEGNLSRLESPQKPLTGLQSYDSEKEQLACVCPSGPLNPNPAWICGLMTEVQSAGFCVVATPECQRNYCPCFQLEFGVITQTKDGRSSDEIEFFDDINPASDSKTARVSLPASVVTTTQGRRPKGD